MKRSPRLESAEEDFVRRHRVGHLATADRQGRPRITPVCFTVLDGCIYVVLDQKPKSVDPRELKRVRNIRENPQVSFLVDDYSEDWEQLAYVQVSGTAELQGPDAAEHDEVIVRLRDKYPQYRGMAIDDRPCIRITPASVNAWSWSGWDNASDATVRTPEV